MWRSSLAVVLEPSAEAAAVVRRLEPDERATIDLIARRMRLTLVEVLGDDRADEMFDHADLVARVEWHLDRFDPERHADVFVASDASGRITGHTLVRMERDDPFETQPVGLFATTYVVPAARRSGVASALLRRGELWMRRQGLDTAVTFTDPSNERLRLLYARHGYQWERVDDEWVRASKTLTDPAG